MRLPLWRMDGLDDAFYVEVAHLWTRGLPPYLYAYDVKPPGFFALLALPRRRWGRRSTRCARWRSSRDAAAAVALLVLGRRFGAPAVRVGRRALLSGAQRTGDRQRRLFAAGGVDDLRLRRRAVAARPRWARARRRPADRRGRRGQANGRFRGAGAGRDSRRRARGGRAARAGRRPSSSPALPSRRSPFSPISPPPAGRARSSPTPSSARSPRRRAPAKD